MEITNKEVTKQVQIPSGYPVYVADLQGNELNVFYIGSHSASEENSPFEETIADTHEVGIQSIHDTSEITPGEIEAHRAFLQDRRTLLKEKLKTLKQASKETIKMEREILIKIQKKDRNLKSFCKEIDGKALPRAFFKGTLKNKYESALPEHIPYHRDVIKGHSKIHNYYTTYQEVCREAEIIHEKQHKIQAKLSLIPNSSRLQDDSIVMADLIQRRLAN
ncbi:MAG: hypothetical protein K2P51_01235 [Rhabdochlamydiaceae bacterium]|nr:hypothetical protein [Rhabdochlamydiaceae bacterium]